MWSARLPVPLRWIFSGRNNSISFPYQQRHTELLGDVYRPVVTAGLWSPVDEVWEQTQMLVDTGADYTLLPRYLAALLGYDLREGRVIQSQGTAGQHRVHFFREVDLRIGEMQRTIPVGFLETNLVPPLLGRRNCLETFTITLDKQSRVTFSE